MDVNKSLNIFCIPAGDLHEQQPSFEKPRSNLIVESNLPYHNTCVRNVDSFANYHLPVVLFKTLLESSTSVQAFWDPLK